ncbi:hypothetical protein ACQ4PT_065116 [Festuca glaucescens]
MAKKGWLRPPAGKVKLNTDATVNLDTRKASTGCIIRDSSANKSVLSRAHSAHPKSKRIESTKPGRALQLLGLRFLPQRQAVLELTGLFISTPLSLQASTSINTAATTRVLPIRLASLRPPPDLFRLPRRHHSLSPPPTMVGLGAGPSYGMQSMLKDGHKHLSGLDEAVLKNIGAARELSAITRTSLGPNGMNKMVINHLDKLFITNDAATIVNELEVQHPAAKLLVLAARAQQEEIGDGANLTISFAGELLEKAEELIRMGLHPSEIIIGYTKAINKMLEILEDLVEKGSENMDVRNMEEVVLRMKSAVASKQFGQEDVLCPLVADACIQVCPKNLANFNVDNVRVAKLVGGGLHNSSVVRGLVLQNDAVGSIKKVEKAKVAVFAGGVDTSATETKGTVLIHSAEQLENYAKTEEAKGGGAYQSCG